MQTVFSYIVQKRLSQENEDVATEALAFIMGSSERARDGLIRLLRGIAPELPALRFRTQQTEGAARPDMWGFDGSTPRVFIENKFWAGLTENQPVEYLRLLAQYPEPVVLLAVVPDARLGTVWREFTHRLTAADISMSPRTPSANVAYIAGIHFGIAHQTTPVLALTSWTNLLRAIEMEIGDELHSHNDLSQLRVLCDAADDESSAPLSSSALTDQRIPARIFRLNAVMERAVNVAVTDGILSIDRLRPASSWERAGRYVSFPQASGVGAWFGTDFRRWRERGTTPLWLVFAGDTFGRAADVRPALEPWVERQRLDCAVHDVDFAVGIRVIAGEELDHVIRSIVTCLRDISTELSGRLPKPVLSS